MRTGIHAARETSRLLGAKPAAGQIPELFGAIVTAVAWPHAKIRPTHAATAGEQLIALPLGLRPQVGDRVIGAYVGGEPVVLAIVAPVGGPARLVADGVDALNVAGQLTTQDIIRFQGANSFSKFQVQNDAFESALWVDTGNSPMRVNVAAGSNLRLLDSGGGVTAEIAGETGAAQVRSLNTPLLRATTANPGTQLSTSSTATPTLAHQTTVTLPTGTWTVRLLGSINLLSSGGQAAVVTSTIDGTSAAFSTRPVATGAYDRIEIAQTKTNVGSGSRTVSIGFHNSTAGTMFAADAALLIWAERTS